jgi:hypothetical protein
MKKIIVPGLAAGVVMLTSSVLLMIAFTILLPGLEAEYMGNIMFRPWSDPLMYYVYLNPIILGFLFAFVWQKVQGSFNDKSKIKSGAKFGLSIFLIFGITGMLMSLSTFNISALMVLTWTISGLIQDILGGIVIVHLYKN